MYVCECDCVCVDWVVQEQEVSELVYIIELTEEHT